MSQCPLLSSSLRVNIIYVDIITLQINDTKHNYRDLKSG